MSQSVRLLSDTNSGLQVDCQGRAFFKQRQVHFETLSLRAREILGSWKHFPEELPLLDWSRAGPDPESIRAFALASSRRFLRYWYAVLDVAMARALAGAGIEVFRAPFFASSVFLDTGLPEEQTLSSVHPALHAKILQEYKDSRAKEARPAVYYLSEYLCGLSDDISVMLAPFETLWQTRLRWKSSARALYSEAIEFRRLSGKLPEMIAFEKDLTAQISRIGQSIIDSGNIQVRNPEARRILFEVKHKRTCITTESLPGFLNEEAFQGYGIPDAIRLWQMIKTFPDKLEQITILLTARFRLQLRQLKIQKKSSGNLSTPGLCDRILHYNNLIKGRGSDLAELPDCLTNLTNLSAFTKDLLIRIAEPVRRLFALLRQLEDALEEMLILHRPASHKPALQKTDQRFGALQLILDEGECPGDPFQEKQILAKARAVLLARLRPLRQTTSEYSTLPEHRHGALALNPVLKLWKSRPNPAEGPALLQLEMNTRQSVSCLLALAELAFPEISRLHLHFEKILESKRGIQTVQTLKIFLIPGSCYPLREVHRLDFPEFSGKVLGESRSPRELGVDRAEDGVLSGSWYSKKTHSLYYPVGGDNGQLLRLIYFSGRAGGPPAFFFGLGQFVYDTLPDAEAYYASGGKPFRRCVEEYYDFEDRVRKNRGEKTGRRRADNSRPAVRFMFGVHFSRIVLEILTGSLQSQFRHPPTDEWFYDKLHIPALRLAPGASTRQIRNRARSIIEEMSAQKNAGK